MLTITLNYASISAVYVYYAMKTCFICMQLLAVLLLLLYMP